MAPPQDCTTLCNGTKRRPGKGTGSAGTNKAKYPTKDSGRIGWLALFIAQIASPSRDIDGGRRPSSAETSPGVVFYLFLLSCTHNTCMNTAIVRALPLRIEDIELGIYRRYEYLRQPCLHRRLHWLGLNDPHAILPTILVALAVTSLCCSIDHLFLPSLKAKFGLRV